MTKNVYTINANNVTINQDISNTQVIDSFNSIIRDVDQSVRYNAVQKEEIKSILNDLRQNIDSMPPKETHSKIEKLKKYGDVFEKAAGWLSQAIDLYIKTSSLSF